VSDKETITLKNGSVVPAFNAVIELQHLSALLIYSPRGQELFDAFHRYCLGQTDALQPADVIELTRSGHLRKGPGGGPEPEQLTKDVLLSSFHRTPEGIVLVSPFPRTVESQEIVARAEAAVRRVTRKIFRDPDDPRDKGRG
jgi:hypothetical protein